MTLDELLQTMLTADNGTKIDGFGYVCGYAQARAVRGVAALLADLLKKEKQGMIYNIMVFYNHGLRLDKPVMAIGRRVLSNNMRSSEPLFACVDDDNWSRKNVVTLLDTVMDVVFAKCGIVVSGLETVMAAPTAAGGDNLVMFKSVEGVVQDKMMGTALAHETKWRTTDVFQRILLTNLSEAELESHRAYLDKL